MDFRLEFDPPALNQKINLDEKIMLVGSCFTEHVYNYLVASKFQAKQNPNGILFNPVSIANALNRYVENKLIFHNELFERDGLWHHWDFHSNLSCTSPEESLQSMNETISLAHEFLKDAKWLIITLGSAFVYELSESHVVANCHKMPAAHFTKRMLAPEEIILTFESVIAQLKRFNERLNIIFTVSPVRHLRDGFIENNRSKSVLIHALDKLTRQQDHLHYFPSYELVIDDLRDYRFYAEDMVHPNYMATRYVWEKFCTACISGSSREVMKELEQLKMAFHHKPLHPDSVAHGKFRNKYKGIALSLSVRFPSIDFSKEIDHFS
jgi:hypothetical protein